MRFKTRDLSANLAAVVDGKCRDISSCTTTERIEEEPCQDPSQPPCEDPSEPAPQPECSETSEPQPAPQYITHCPTTEQCGRGTVSEYGPAAKHAIRAQMTAAAGQPGPRRGRR